jgi:hypothetical protein
VLFSAGEALTFIWGDVPVTADMILNTNYGSLSERTNYLTSEMQVSSLTASDRSVNDNESHIMAREVIIKKLFEALLYSSRKEERCAGTVWLVSLTMYCGHHKRIQELLPEIQVCCSEHNSFLLLNSFGSQQLWILYFITSLQICNHCRKHEYFSIIFSSSISFLHLLGEK